MSHRLEPKDRDLIFDFVWKFSLFECALKREGFLKHSSDYNGADANWGKFGRKIKGRFGEVSTPGFKDAVDRLWRLSPRRQVVCLGKLGWEDVKRRPSDSVEEYTLYLLKTSRNNLFHGGKYSDDPVAEIARDRNILTAGLTILTGCSELHTGVKRWLREAA